MASPFDLLPRGIPLAELIGLPKNDTAALEARVGVAALVLTPAGMQPPRILSEAERVLDEALELSPPDVDAEEAAQTVVALAKVFEARGNTASAILQLSQVFHVVKDRTLADRTFWYTQWLSLARLRALSSDLPAATEALAVAREAALKVRSARGLAEVEEALARLAVNASDAAQAQNHLDAAAEHWLAWGDRVAAARCLQGAARIAMHTAGPGQAAERLAHAIALARAADWHEGAAAMRTTLEALHAD